MAGERQTETTASAAPTASAPASIPEAWTGGRRDQVPLRSETAEAVTGDRDDRQRQAIDGSQDHSRRHSAGAAADAPEDPGEADVTAAQAEGPLSLDDIEGHALRAIRYHEARARFLDFWRRVLDFLVVLLGAGAVSSATQGSAFWTTVIGVALAAIGALQLVAGFSEKAGEHASLKRRFCGVLADITEARGEPELTSRRLAKITKKWSGIWADEPPTLHVLEAIAWNAARRSRERDLDENTLIEISPWQSFTRNLSSWEGFEPLTRAERAERAGKGGDGLRWWQRPRT